MFYTNAWHGHVHIRSYGQFASSRWRHILHGLNTSYFHNGQARYTASIPPMVGIEQWRALFLLMWIQSVVFTATISFFPFSIAIECIVHILRCNALSTRRSAHLCRVTCCGVLYTVKNIRNYSNYPYIYYSVFDRCMESNPKSVLNHISDLQLHLKCRN